MAIKETTGGDFIISFSNCDCHSTGGCEKCRPHGMAVDQRITIKHGFTYPEFVERLRVGIDAHPEWDVKYL